MPIHEVTLVHKRSTGERLKAAKERFKRERRPKRIRTAKEKIGDKKRAKAMKRGRLASKIAAMASQIQEPANLTGSVQHPAAYIKAVLETAAYMTTGQDLSTSATNPRDFAKQFLDKKPQETNSPVGMAAVLFEAYLMQNEESLYSQMVETWLEPGEKTFLAVFEGPLTRDKLSRLIESVRPFVETKVLVRHGQRTEHEVSDLTIIECTPVQEGLAALGKDGAPAHAGAASGQPRIHKQDAHQFSSPTRQPVGPFEDFRPASEDDYGRILEEGGVTLDILEAWYPDAPVRSDDDTLFIETDDATWYSDNKGQTWNPSSFISDEARADLDEGKALTARDMERGAKAAAKGLSVKVRSKENPEWGDWKILRAAKGVPGMWEISSLRRTGHERLLSTGDLRFWTLAESEDYDLDEADYGKGVTVKRDKHQVSEQRWLVVRNGTVIGFVTKAKDARGETHPFKAFARGRGQAKALGATYQSGGFDAAVQAVVDNKALKEDYDLDEAFALNTKFLERYWLDHRVLDNEAGLSGVSERMLRELTSVYVTKRKVAPAQRMSVRTAIAQWLQGKGYKLAKGVSPTTVGRVSFKEDYDLDEKSGGPIYAVKGKRVKLHPDEVAKWKKRGEEPPTKGGTIVKTWRSPRTGDTVVDVKWDEGGKSSEFSYHLVQESDLDESLPFGLKGKPSQSAKDIRLFPEVHKLFRTIPATKRAKYVQYAGAWMAGEPVDKTTGFFAVQSDGSHKRFRPVKGPSKQPGGNTVYPPYPAGAVAVVEVSVDGGKPSDTPWVYVAPGVKESDLDEQKWRTTDRGRRIHINKDGVVDKGNPHVVQKGKPPGPARFFKPDARIGEDDTLAVLRAEGIIGDAKLDEVLGYKLKAGDKRVIQAFVDGKTAKDGPTLAIEGDLLVGASYSSNNPLAKRDSNGFVTYINQAYGNVSQTKVNAVRKMAKTAGALKLKEGHDPDESRTALHNSWEDSTLQTLRKQGVLEGGGVPLHSGASAPPPPFPQRQADGSMAGTQVRLSDGELRDPMTEAMRHLTTVEGDREAMADDICEQHDLGTLTSYHIDHQQFDPDTLAPVRSTLTVEGTEQRLEYLWEADAWGPGWYIVHVSADNEYTLAGPYDSALAKKLAQKPEYAIKAKDRTDASRKADALAQKIGAQRFRHKPGRYESDETDEATAWNADRPGASHVIATVKLNPQDVKMAMGTAKRVTGVTVYDHGTDFIKVKGDYAYLLNFYNRVRKAPGVEKMQVLPQMRESDDLDETADLIPRIRHTAKQAALLRKAGKIPQALTLEKKVDALMAQAKRRGQTNDAEAAEQAGQEAAMGESLDEADLAHVMRGVAEAKKKGKRGGYWQESTSHSQGWKTWTWEWDDGDDDRKPFLMLASRTNVPGKERWLVRDGGKDVFTSGSRPAALAFVKQTYTLSGPFKGRKTYESIDEDRLTITRVDLLHETKVSQDEANYQDGPVDTKTCDSCAHWRNGSCTEVAGTIKPKGTSDLWTRKGTEASEDLDEAEGLALIKQYLPGYLKRNKGSEVFAMQLGFEYKIGSDAARKFLDSWVKQGKLKKNKSGGYSLAESDDTPAWSPLYEAGYPEVTSPTGDFNQWMRSQCNPVDYGVTSTSTSHGAGTVSVALPPNADAHLRAALQHELGGEQQGPTDTGRSLTWTVALPEVRTSLAQCAAQIVRAWLAWKREPTEPDLAHYFGQFLLNDPSFTHAPGHADGSANPYLLPEHQAHIESALMQEVIADTLALAEATGTAKYAYATFDADGQLDAAYGKQDAPPTDGSGYMELTPDGDCNVFNG